MGNPVYEAYRILVELFQSDAPSESMFGAIEEAIGYLGEALE